MDISHIPTFADDGAFHVVVESPRGATVKLKFHPVLRAIVWGRPLTSGLSYPFDWGFIAGTHASDGDPVDAMVLWEGSTYPGVVVPCRALGLVKVEQDRKDAPGRERNDRVIAVPAIAPIAIITQTTAPWCLVLVLMSTEPPCCCLFGAQ